MRDWLRALLRRFARPDPAHHDPWTAVPQRVPLPRFGAGAVRDFRWYFEGESRVRVGSLEELCEWLLACEYVRDRDLFHEHDFWQHPRTFEQLRKGDCEDHALWAWRKLVELGHSAELVTGEALRDDGTAISHVWVVFTQDGVTYLLETTAPSREAMMRPVDEVRARYIPHWGITGDMQSRGYAGYFVRRRATR